MKMEDRFRGKFAYTVTAAPAPSDVMFENLDVSELSRFLRRRAINLVTGAGPSQMLLMLAMSRIPFYLKK